MRILALDVGTKTIGVAVSDELGIAAHGVTTIKRIDLKRDLEALRKIIDQYKPSEILVGVPYNYDGTVSKRGDEILKFAEKIKATFSLPVEYCDESFSTVDAEKILLEADLLDNFFIPSSKLIQKLRDNSGRVIRRVHDKPKTPFQRLLECEQLSEHDKQRIKKIFKSLDMVELRQEVNKILQILYEIRLMRSRKKIMI